MQLIDFGAALTIGRQREGVARRQAAEIQLLPGGGVENEAALGVERHVLRGQADPGEVNRIAKSETGNTVLRQDRTVDTQNGAAQEVDCPVAARLRAAELQGSTDEIQAAVESVNPRKDNGPLAVAPGAGGLRPHGQAVGAARRAIGLDNVGPNAEGPPDRGVQIHGRILQQDSAACDGGHGERIFVGPIANKSACNDDGLLTQPTQQVGRALRRLERTGVKLECICYVRSYRLIDPYILKHITQLKGVC